MLSVVHGLLLMLLVPGAMPAPMEESSMRGPAAPSGSVPAERLVAAPAPVIASPSKLKPVQQYTADPYEDVGATMESAGGPGSRDSYPPRAEGPGSRDSYPPPAGGPDKGREPPDCNPRLPRKGGNGDWRQGDGWGVGDEGGEGDYYGNGGYYGNGYEGMYEGQGGYPDGDYNGWYNGDNDEYGEGGNWQGGREQPWDGQQQWGMPRFDGVPDLPTAMFMMKMFKMFKMFKEQTGGPFNDMPTPAFGQFNPGMPFPGQFSSIPFPGPFPGMSFPGSFPGMRFPGPFSGPFPGMSFPGPFPGMSFPGPFPGKRFPGPFPGRSYSGPFSGKPFPGQFPGMPFPGSRPAFPGPKPGPKPGMPFPGPKPGMPFPGLKLGMPFPGPRPGMPFPGPRPGMPFPGPKPGMPFPGPYPRPCPRRRPWPRPRLPQICRIATRNNTEIFKDECKREGTVCIMINQTRCRNLKISICIPEECEKLTNMMARKICVLRKMNSEMISDLTKPQEEQDSGEDDEGDDNEDSYEAEQMLPGKGSERRMGEAVRELMMKHGCPTPGTAASDLFMFED